MSLILVLGDPRAGKTLYTTAEALAEKQRPVYANYKIEIPAYQKLTPISYVSENRPILAILDEAWRYIDSRVSTSKANRFWSYMLFQSGKAGNDIYLTFHLPSVIDLRFRGLYNYLVVCNKESDGIYYSITKRSATKLYRPIEKFLSWENAALIYPYYDTYERIKVPEGEMMDLTIDDIQDVMPEIDTKASELLQSHTAKYYSKAVLSDICRELGWGQKQRDALYNRIQRIGH